MSEEYYVSIDIESFGPIPGVNSMVNFGAVAYTSGTKEKLGQFSANLLELEGSVRNQSTMNNFWLLPEQKNALEAITTDPRPAADVMPRFKSWIHEMTAASGAQPVLVAYPSGFDFTFLYWYWTRFLGEYPPFWFRCIDIQSFAAGKLDIPLSECTKERALGPLSSFILSREYLPKLDAVKVVSVSIDTDQIINIWVIS